MNGKCEPHHTGTPANWGEAEPLKGEPRLVADALTRTAHQRLQVSRQVVIESLACLYETQEAVRRSLKLIRKSDEFLRRFQRRDGSEHEQD